MPGVDGRRQSQTSLKPIAKHAKSGRHAEERHETCRSQTIYSWFYHLVDNSINPGNELPDHSLHTLFSKGGYVPYPLESRSS